MTLCCVYDLEDSLLKIKSRVEEVVISYVVLKSKNKYEAKFQHYPLFLDMYPTCNYLRLCKNYYIRIITKDLLNNKIIFCIEYIRNFFDDDSLIPMFFYFEQLDCIIKLTRFCKGADSSFHLVFESDYPIDMPCEFNNIHYEILSKLIKCSQDRNTYIYKLF